MINRFSPKRVLATCAGIWLCLLVTAGPVPTNKPAAYPDWWFTEDVIPVRPEFSTLSQTTIPPLKWPDHYPPADDYAAANVGQLKHIAKQAAEAMDAKLPLPGAGSAVHAVVDPWSLDPAFGSPPRDDFAAINIGQLKAVAKPFYLRLQELGYTGKPFLAGQVPTPAKPYPWSFATTTTADDFALANIGQVKNLFSFDLAAIDPNLDSDGDGLPNAWEIQFGLNPNDQADAFQDPDGDGLTNLQEYLLGTSPNLANVLQDTDQDGMPDAYEILAGLNIAFDDSLEDKDGDRVPNIFEFKRATLANDPASKPQATFIVNSASGNSSTTDNIYATITQAVQAANNSSYNNGKYTYPNAYAVIEVRSGSYTEQVYLNGQPVLLLGELGSLQGPPVILGRSDYDDYSLRLESASVVESFIITKSPGRKGGGVSVGTSYGSTSKRRRLINCVIRGNETTTGGGVYNNGANLDLVHCTILANKGTSQGRAIYNGSSGILNLINSIVWGNTGTATQEIFKASSSTSIVTVTQSIVAGGEQGGINADPQLTSAGWLRSTSPAINRAGVATVVSYDIQGEARSVGTTPDLGADEYKDNNGASDGDGLPDWAETPSASGASDDADGDGLTNSDEYLRGTNPKSADSDGDGLNDGAEVAAGTNPLNSDSDGDGMTDGYEVTNLLNPLADDSLEDKDGDRVPNIFEFKRGTMANDPASKPQATFIVNPASGNSSTTDNIYATITQAVQAANAYTYNNGQYTQPNAYAVIEVRSGSYAHQVYLNGQPVLLLGELGSLQGAPVILGNSDYDDYSLRFETASVVDGFIITKTPSRKGGGVYVSSSYSSTSKRRRLVNCVIRGNETSYGGGVYNNATNLDLVHCTILANKGTSQGRAIYNGSGTLNLINSIVWGNTGTATQEIFKDSSSTNIVTVTQSIVAGGEQGGINADPQLTPAGWLRSTSPAINRAGVAMVVTYDIHGEARSVGTTPDLGADEYKDNNGTSDGDGLADWAETSSASGASGDADGDGLTNSDEYLRGTNLLSSDSDGDSLNDGAEVTAGTSPLNPDSDSDGMTDGYEVANLLNSLADDSLEDKDGDRIPNIFEFKRGTMANDPVSKPQATIIVNPATGNSSTTDNIYATITEAVEAANYYDNGQYTYPNAYAVIEVRSGSYTEQVYLNGQPVLLLGELGSLQGPPVILGRSDYDDYSLRLESASVVESFIITKTLGRKAGGVSVGTSYGSTSKRRRLVNCIIQGNESYSGGGVYNFGANLDLVHCTILANKGTSQGRAIYNGSSGTLNLINSIVWGNTGTATQEIFNDSSSTSIVTVTQSIVAGGEQGGINADPQLTSAGWLRSTSPAINRTGVATVVSYDIHGEARSVGTTSDLGADEYKDNNGTSDDDGLPDWAETSSASGASGDADGDGLTNSDEYIRGTNPLNLDSDGDSLNDGAEVTAGTSPLNPDSDSDGMTDSYEVTKLLNPLADDSLLDKDGDSLSNIWEFTHGFDASDPADANRDADADGLTNLGEYLRGTNPKSADSDGDGLNDGAEVTAGTNPLNWDSDGDLLPDGWEVQYGLDPLSTAGASGASGDPDLDGLSNFQEWSFGANPTSPDSDSDGVLDGLEVEQGSVPNDSSDGGRPPEAAKILETKIIIGDPSGSHSERWRVEVRDLETGKMIVNHASLEYGELSAESGSVFKQFRKGRAYEFKLIWVATDPQKLAQDPDGAFFPDYDWALEISYKDNEGNWVDVTEAVDKRFLVLDPWDSATTTIAENNVQLLVNRNNLSFPWEGQSDRTDQYEAQIAPKRVMLVPASLVVDADRNGAIDIDSGSDNTTEDKPFRFWSNDDDDGVDPVGSDTAPAVRKDSQDSYISNNRDLEDFARLHLYLGGLQDSFVGTNPKLKIGLKWKNVTSGAPSIRVFRTPAAQQGSDDYLKDAAAGTTLRATANAQTTALLVSGTSSVMLPVSFLDALSTTQPNAWFVFEGVTEGKGQLVITIHKPDGTEIGEGPGVWIDLKNIKKMYQRVKALADGGDNIATPSDFTGPSDNNIPNPVMSWADDANGYTFEAPSGETKTCIVMVHGWNQTYERATMYAETAFKRLWQRGYKGRFVRFRWPTYIGEFTYNDSEYRAWKCGQSLQLYLDSIPRGSGGFTVNMIAHSMGNIVAGEALRRGASVTNYALWNAAVPASCYDGSAALNQGWGYTHPNDDPDSFTRNLTYQGRLAGVSGNLINFFLPADDALVKWEWNNDSPGVAGRFNTLGFKPQPYNAFTTGYGYDRAAATGQKLFITFMTAFGRYLVDAHEAMAYAVQSPTLTVGAEGRTAGAISDSVGMQAFGFGDVHSAQFLFPLQKTKDLYDTLLIKFQIAPQP
jgi:hypothetical protein